MANKSVGLLTIAFGADLRGFDKAMKKAQRSIKKFGASMQQIGQDLTRNITLPIAGLAIAAVKMASDYEESLNKVRVSFGETSHVVEAFAKTTLKSFGIAEGSALEMASLFGDMGTSMGLTQKNAANMSTALVGLAGDLASFKNISQDIAQTALASIFTGETESLKKLGIVMTETNLKQFALEQGITLSIKKMSQAQKVQLRYNFVMSKSANALGDYINTSDGVANSTRTLTESIKELGQQFGVLLIPMAKKIILELQKLVDKFKSLTTEQKENIIFWGKILAVLGPSLILIGKLSLGFVAVTSTIGGTIKALGLLRIALLTNPITALIVALSAGIVLLVANLATMDIATKKSKKLYDDLVETKEKLAKLNNDELKTLKARTQIELESLGISLKKEKQKLDDLASKTNPGNNLLLGPDLGDSNAGVDANKFQLSDQTKIVTDLTNLYNKQFSIIKLINETLKDNGEIITSSEKTGEILTDQTKKWETYYEIIEEGSSLATQAQERLSKVTEFFGGVLSAAMTSAAYSQDNFFKALFENIKKAIRQLLIQLAIMTAIAIIMGKADSVGAAIKMSASKMFDFDTKVPFANGGLVTGPVSALIGEGVGTSASNPEVVAPLDKLKSMISNGNSQKIEIFGKISGNDIFLSNSKSTNSRLRGV